MSNRSNPRGCTVSLLTAIPAMALQMYDVLPAQAWPYVYSTQYEMNADPSTPAGVIDCDAGDYNGNGLLSVGFSGSGATFVNGVMEYNDYSSSGGYGYYFAHSPPAETSFTIDMRVKVASGVSPRTGGSRSLSFSGGPGGRARGLRLNTDGVEIVNGSGVLVAAGVDLASNFVRLRVTYNSATNAYSCYNLDTASTLIASVLGGGSGAAGEIIEAGGWAIGSLSSGSTTDTHFFMDYYRILIGTAIENADPIVGPIAPVYCAVSVTPGGTEARTGYAFGAAPAPGPVLYTIDNSGNNTVHYTASEVDALGAAFDYPWMSLNPTSGSVTGGADVVAATLDTAALAAGSYTGYVKLTDDCVCFGCYCSSGDPVNEHILRIDLTVIGCSIQVQEPRIRWEGPCSMNRMTTESFTIKNNGSADWTGFDVQEVSDDPWISLSYTGGPVARFATATVTARIDWFDVPTGTDADRYSRLRFGASCDGGVTSVFDTPVGTGGEETVNVRDPDPPPVVIRYFGRVVPSAEDSAGTGYKFQLIEGTDQGTVVPDFEASDGYAYRITDESGAKTKWASVTNVGGPAMDIDARVGATAVARVKVTSDTEVIPNQKNLIILHNTIAGSCHWEGVNNVVQEATRGVQVNIPGDSMYHTIRVSTKDTQAPGIGIVVNLYLDENSVPVMTITNATAAGDGLFEGIGFGTSSTANSQDIYFDWVFGTNAGAFAPGEEEACLSTPPPPRCLIPSVDVDHNGYVDMNDFAVFQACYTGSGTFSLSWPCQCFDHEYDSDIDVADFHHFVDCATGPDVWWVPSVNCPG